MPSDFIGLSYEIQQLTDVSFFSAENAGLIRQFKVLSASGVLRLGGNTSEFAYWKPAPETPEPEHPRTREVVGEPRAQYYPVTKTAIRNLGAFLDRTGWTCIYGIGLGTNIPERAAEEAEYVAQTLGPRLQYFQIGNEVDTFGRHLRDPRTWNAEAYLKDWLPLARAISGRIRNAKFGMPDIAGNMSWLTQIADLWQRVEDQPHVVMLTHHYYFGGPATDPEVNIPNLLKVETMDKVQRTADVAAAASAKMGARVRMTEGNTCYRGGKLDLSDVFAASLWSADYALLLASKGYAGLNLHGGTGKSVANSVGGFLPGDIMLQEQGATPNEIASRPHPFYTPIATFGKDYRTMPVGYGLRFAGQFCGGSFFQPNFTSVLQESGVNATAYGVKFPGEVVSIIVLNKDPERDLDVTFDFGSNQNGEVETETLHAPNLESRVAYIDEPVRRSRQGKGKYSVVVRRATGLKLTLRPQV